MKYPFSYAQVMNVQETISGTALGYYSFLFSSEDVKNENTIPSIAVTLTRASQHKSKSWFFRDKVADSLRFGSTDLVCRIVIGEGTFRQAPQAYQRASRTSTEL